MNAMLQRPTTGWAGAETTIARAERGAPGVTVRAEAGGTATLDDWDPMAQLAQADAADATLLRLVLCVASATLALALVTSLA